MPGRTDTTPLLVQAGDATPLVRVPFTEREHDEAWLQQLLFKHPLLIPVDEIEPVFAPLVPVARELSTPVGYLDVLFVSPEGYPTLVETKLWRNPEARRQVVAQAIDYAVQFSRWSYYELAEAVRASRSDLPNGDPFPQLMHAHAESWEHALFVDNLARNLRLGRMLLLVIGDGIHEAVEQMAETLSRTPHLGFTLALVEMAMFRPSGRREPLIVQPRIVVRTREVVRAVVEVRGESKPEDVRVTLPAADEAPPHRRTLTEEAFFEALQKQTSPSIANGLRALLPKTAALGVTTLARQASLSLHYLEPFRGARFSFGSVRVDSGLDMFYVVYFFSAAGLDQQIGRDYLEDVARLVPGARVHVWNTRSGPASAVRIGRLHVTVDRLLEHRSEWLSAMERMIGRTNDAMRTV